MNEGIFHGREEKREREREDNGRREKGNVTGGEWEERKGDSGSERGAIRGGEERRQQSWEGEGKQLFGLMNSSPKERV